MKILSMEVFIHQDPERGDVILSRKSETWGSFLVALKNAKAPANFLNKKERNQGVQKRDPFKDWHE